MAGKLPTGGTPTQATHRTPRPVTHLLHRPQKQENPRRKRRQTPRRPRHATSREKPVISHHVCGVIKWAQDKAWCWKATITSSWPATPQVHTHLFPSIGVG
ncbi:Hypothetical predicted protein [Pelobates cultripes]|uniref:Uncharacterized protein n=1 Tax=Pelobates cultripes TaxID=61616 RepID=A0AAD1W551_PELCU|nr:Hypothetical predicted protein [Pelobates cultripes]